MKRTGREPNSIQAGTYSAVRQYIKAVETAGTDATLPVAKKLHEMPVEDMFARHGKVQKDGSMVYDMHLFEVKAPAESKGEWDAYKQLATIPAEQAFLSDKESGCPSVQ